MSLFSSKKRVLGVAALILLLLFLLRPGASRLKSRIVLSMSSALGRNVDLGAVHLRLLPRPGFDLDNLVVYDDPAFGAEPLLRCSEVTADVRLLSLLRGKLEIARLNLTEPSLNLVRGENGQWNVEGLLERTAHTPLAPTAKAKSEPRPGFPYIEASSARINFKSGQEKKPYALTDARFSLWQDSENAWGVRLKAQPSRTDLNVNDTGQLQVSGTWQRAAVLHDTPVDFSIEWNRAQLGQLSKFFTGNDKGWRGGVQLDVTLTGTPANLQIASSAVLDDFRRYDILAGEPLRLAASCQGQYHSTEREIRDLLCDAPVGAGALRLKGDLGLPGSGKYGLLLTAENIPASAALALAEHAKKNLADDLTASGEFHASVTIDGDGDSVRAEGRGEIAELQLVSLGEKSELGPETIPFVIASGKSSSGQSSSGQSLSGQSLSGQSLSGQALESRRMQKSKLGLPDGVRIEFGPFSAAAGRSGGPKLSGWIARSGYHIAIAGEGQIERELGMARLFGLATPRTAVEGLAQLDLVVSGSWAGANSAAGAGFAGPTTTGEAKLRNMRVTVPGGPVEIISADLQLLPDKLEVQKVDGKAAGANWTGSLEMPRGCGTPSACEVHFDLRTKQLALAELSAWVSPGTKERPWYSMAGPSATPFLAEVRASGRIAVDRIQIQNVAATGVAGKVSLEAGKFAITDLTAEMFGGKHQGEWRGELGSKPATCTGSGTVTGVTLARFADAMKDPWIDGIANASFEFSGICADGFWQTAEGTVRFDIRDGSLPHISLAEEHDPIRIKSLRGQARLRGGEIEINEAKLDSPAGEFQVSGTASLRRELELKFVRKGGAPGYAVTGTLAAPRVTATAVEQAKLK